MSTRDDLTRLLEKHSVTDLSKELSVILDQRARDAAENGDLIYSERLQAAADQFWRMEDFGI